MNNDIFAGFIAENFSNYVGKGLFPYGLKHADVTSVHKMKNRNDNTNYRSVIISTNVSKIYENLIYNQLYDSFDDMLSPSQCGFCKGYSTQHCLLVMFEKNKETVSKSNEFVCLLADL